MRRPPEATFAARTRDLAALRAAVAARLEGAAGPAVVLSGEVGSGRSTLLRRLAHQLGERARLVTGASGALPDDAYSAGSEVLLVDDAHALARAQATALRRYTRDHVVVVALDSAAPASEFGTADVELHPLTVGDAQTALASPWVAPRLVALSGGNLAVVVANRHFPPGGHVADLHLPPAVLAAFSTHLHDLPAEVRFALLVLAASPSSAVPFLERALGLGAGATGGPARLEAAMRSGLLHEAGGSVRFHHPLVRAAAYHSAPDAARLAAFGAVADAAASVGDVEAEAWARLACTEPPDEAVAGALERAADLAAARGDLATAGRAMLRAAGCSDVGDEAARRCLAAAAHLFAAGQRADAVHAADRGLRDVTSAEVHGALVAMRESTAMWIDGPLGPAQRLEEAAARYRTSAPHLAAVLLARATVAHVLAGDVNTACATAREVEQCAAGIAGTVRSAVEVAGTYASLFHGDRVWFERSFAPLADAAERLAPRALPETWSVLDTVALGHLMCGETLASVNGLEDRTRRATESGHFGQLPTTLILLAEGLWRAGRFADAGAALDRVDHVFDEGERVRRAWAAAMRARLEIATGDVATGRARATAALADAESIGAGLAALWARHARSSASAVTGDLAAAADDLDALATLTEAGGLREPGILWWQADHLEVLLALGRVRDCRFALARLERDGSARPWPVAAAARARALLATRRAVGRTFGEAVAAHEALDAPFELARTVLAWGERLRADGDAGARVQLAAAIDRFDALGATPWAARARLLRGDRPIVRTASLTERERMVATRVGQGLTNAEVAASLGVSIKTVEFHLGNVYGKLGIRSRSELVRAAARGLLAPPE